MDDKKRLPDAELAVMQAIWAVGGEVSRGSFVAALNAEQPLEQSEIDELRQFLDDMSR